MTTPSSEHPRDELAILALDALDPDDRDGIEAHVRDCPACQAELDDYRATLALVAPEEPVPPAAAWDRIAEQVAATSNGHGRRPADGPPGGGPPSPAGFHDVGPAAAPTPQGGTRPVGLASPAGPADPAGLSGPAGARDAGAAEGGQDGPVVELHARRSGPPGLHRLAAASRPLLVAAAALVVVVLGVGLALRPSGSDGDEVLAAARRALEAPDSSVADLLGPEGQVIAQVVVEGDEGYALVGSLGDLPDGREYQLWSLDGTDATSLGMVGDGSAPAVTVRPAGAEGDRLAITEEPAGGVDAPTGPVVATGTFA
jgi:hypothetical protein